MFVNVSYTHPVIVLAYLAITIAALLSVWRSGGDTARKVIWTVVILALPYVGALLWVIKLALDARHRTSSGA